MATVEEWAKQYGRLHPDVALLLGPYFKIDLRQVKIEVHPTDWWAFGKSGRGMPTPIFVVFSTVYVVEGFLNKPGRTWTNTCDLANETGEGWKQLAHELKHVEQYETDGGAAMIWRYLSGLVRSWWATGGARSWYHSSIPFETAAEAFAVDVAKRIKAQATAQFWAKWRGLQ